MYAMHTMHPNLTLNTNVLRVKFGNIFQGTGLEIDESFGIPMLKVFHYLKNPWGSSRGTNSIEVMNFNDYVNGKPLNSSEIL